MASNFRRMLPVAIVGFVAVAGLASYFGRPKYDATEPFAADNGLRVAYENDTIEVFGRAGASGPGYFYAAAEFSRKILKESMTSYLVVSVPEGDSPTRPGTRSVQFVVVDTEQGRELPDPGATVSVTTAGQGRTIAFALQMR